MDNIASRAMVLLSLLYRTFFFLFCNFFPMFHRPPKGNNGLAGFRFGLSQIQNLLYFAGYDLSYPPFTKPCGSGSNCVLPFIGQVRNSPSFFHLSHMRCLSMGPPFLYFIAMGSQFDHSPRKWDMLCDSGSHVTNYRRLGRLWDLEVSRG